MNHKVSTCLSDEKFKRLIGVKQEVFNNKLACLEQAQATIHQRGSRKLKIGILNLLMATLQLYSGKQKCHTAKVQCIINHHKAIL
ncbi:hypothetical protein [Moraxella lincolnii]|nr:hypothetical protein [Moraxella lincolnii]